MGPAWIVRQGPNQDRVIAQAIEVHNAERVDPLWKVGGDFRVVCGYDVKEIGMGAG
jgi:hypothetical protein